MRRNLLAGAIAAPMMLCAPLAGAEVVEIFQDNFQSARLKSQWSSNTPHETEGPAAFTWFAGRLNNNTIHLTLPAVPPPGGRDDGYDDGGDDGSGGDGDGGGGGGGGDFDLYVRYFVSFDLYIIDSWDGDRTTNGPDRFEVLANGGTIFSETFANQHDEQSYPGRPDVGPVHLGYNGGAKDSIYRQIRREFTIPESDPQLRLSFRAVGLQSLNDESWGIDNVHVGYEIVPAPGAGAVLGLGLLGLSRRRR
ncbi:MAG: hypothetical protein H6811_01285 [Phycisphaeraceae bacterium]|nr:hypothetical protein [Phycisphaeraceae bacterium]